MKKLSVMLTIIALILLIFINPSKISIFNFAAQRKYDIREIKSINIDEDAKYKVYNGTLCLLDDNKLKIIDKEGKDIYNQSINAEDINLSINNYIDILNKKTNKGFSLNENGKVMFSTSVTSDSVLYKSMGEHVFINILNNDGKELMKIIDSGGEVNNRIEINGKITHLKSIDDYILVSYINVLDAIENKATLIDANGNIKNEISFNNIILDIIYNDESIYIVFEDKIQVLDKNLSLKEDISIDGVCEIEEYNNSNLYIKNSKNKWGYIEQGRFKIIKTQGENLRLAVLNDTYILYSNNTIYNNKLQEISKLDDNIKEIKYLGDNFIVIIHEDKIKIFKIN